MSDLYIIPQAWECPRCHKINAPHVEQCNCSPFWVTINGIYYPPVSVNESWPQIVIQQPPGTGDA